MNWLSARKARSIDYGTPKYPTAFHEPGPKLEYNPAHGTRARRQTRALRILEPHSKGRMGVVVSCSGRQARWDIATKVLRDGLAETKGRLARFKREAKVLALLNHPGIAAIRGPPPKTLRAPPYAIRRNLRRIMLRHD